MDIQSRIGSIPIVGYFLKLVHDIVTLPIIRRHLRGEIRALELRSVPRDEYSREITALEQRLTASIPAADVAAMKVLLATTVDHISEAGAVVRDLRELEEHAAALAASARRAKRDQSGLMRELARVSERIAALDARVTGLAEMLHSEIQRRMTPKEQSFASRNGG